MIIVPQEHIIHTRNLEDEGWLAYYEGVPYGELTTEEERAGWLDAYGENAYHRDCLANGVSIVSQVEELPC